MSKSTKAHRNNIIKHRDVNRHDYFGYGFIKELQKDIITLAWSKQPKKYFYDTTYLRNVILITDIFKG